jgi:hypothetical protein
LFANLRYPITLLRESVQNVPANVYAVGVVGIVAAAVICIILTGNNWLVALGGGVAVFAGMVVLRIFANPGTGTRTRQRPAEVIALTWLSLAAFVLVLSFFLGKLYFVLFPDRHTTASPLPSASGQSGSITVHDLKQDVKGDNNVTTGINTGTLGAKDPSASKE